MAGLGIRLIGGALSGLGDGMLEQAKANRTMMLEQLKRSQELADKQTEDAHQDQRQKDQQIFQAGENDKTRAAENTRQAAGFTQADKIQGRTIDAEGKRQGIMIGAENQRNAATIEAANTRNAADIADKQKARDDNYAHYKLDPVAQLIKEHDDGLVDDDNFKARMQKLNALPRSAAGAAGYNGVKKWAYDTHLANHPGDIDGAEQAASGHKPITDTELVIQAKRLAIGEANSFATPATLAKLEADNLKALKASRDEFKKSLTAEPSKPAGPRLPASPLRRDGGTSSAPAPQGADAPANMRTETKTPPANLLKPGRRQHVTAPDGTDMGYWTLGANGQPQQVQ